MADLWLIVGTLVACFIGCAWLAMAMDAHWRQVLGTSKPPSGTRALLRTLGSLALLLSLALTLAVDHASIAALVWIMTLAAAALLVAFTLAWRARWLAFTVPWLKAHGHARS